MAVVNAEMNLVLANSVENAHAHLKGQARFAEAVKAFRSQLLRDLDSSNAAAQTYFQQLVDALDSAVQTIIARISTAAQIATEDVRVLGHVSTLDVVLFNMVDTAQNIRDSNSKVVDLQKNVGKVFQEVLSGSSQLASSQLRDWEVNRALATEVRSSLETIRGTEVDALLQTLGSIHRDLVRTVATLASFLVYSHASSKSPITWSSVCI